MFDTYHIRESAMPAEMQTLLARDPRDSWEAHPGFREKTMHWLGAHQMFRRVAERIRLDTEAVLAKDVSLDDYAGRLSYYGGNLVGNLHGHHGWEDRSYFPELAAADPRFAAGLDVLEQDHADLDRVLDEFTRQANRVIKLSALDEAQARDEAGVVHDTSRVIEAFLKRHLTDEEDLAVPIILHHRLRG
ncbi:cation-binding protein [Loktanella sp. 3ANDIMAR09]|uniref:hemerythrin domain-containing protein n=1 Tax=Loktanella sp. 3ANDIMAR09 TaxID=1225657 RepID=UPI0006FDEACF|nr:hemerythrin domain-containing protein [Loktanella sp. 3ANDIMAR09]KQI67909.1 cation-binding protein [Loktanella sp. 3ANDIMAR09]